MVRKMRGKVTLSVAVLAIGGLAEAAAPTPASRETVSQVPVKTAQPLPASRLVRPKPQAPPTSAAKTPLPASRLVRPKPQAPPTSAAKAPRRPFANKVEPKQLVQLEDFMPVQAGPDDLNVEVPDAAETPDAEMPAAEESAGEVPTDDLNLDGIDATLPESNPSPELRDEAPPAVRKPAESLPPPATKAPVVSGGIFRLEPPQKLVPVASNDLKPGVIYLHDSPTLGRQVWSFLQADYQFWHAFGPGTTQSVDHFDLRMTSEERKESLKKIDPKLAFDVSDTGAKVFMRLEADNTWKLVRVNSVPSIFDLETNERWEKQWDRYLPVIHNCGNAWQRVGDRYEAAGWDDGTVGGWDEGTIAEGAWVSE